jgi:type VI protein secretion system component VasK
MERGAKLMFFVSLLLIFLLGVFCLATIDYLFNRSELNRTLARFDQIEQNMKREQDQ